MATRARATVVVVTGARRRSKYGAIKSKAYGYTFDSKFERAHADDLERQRLAGEIRSWCRPGAILLVDAPLYRDRIFLRVDFHVTNLDWSEEYHETKGKVTEAWGLKKRLWMAFGPHVPMIVFYLQPKGKVERVERRTSIVSEKPPGARTPRRTAPKTSVATKSASSPPGAPPARTSSRAVFPPPSPADPAAPARVTRTRTSNTSSPAATTPSDRRDQ